MPLFSYKGIDLTGRTHAGELDAADRKSAVQKLGTQGIRPLSLTQKDKPAVADVDETGRDFFASSVKLPEIKLLKGNRQALTLEFLKRLHVLLAAGMSLGDAVRLLSVRLSDPELKALCNQIWKSLSEGRTLAAAMAEHPNTFSPSVVHLIEAGEASGALRAIIQRLVDYLEEVRQVRGNVISSLSYPALVFFVASGVVFILLTFLLPRIQAMLAQLGGKLPLMTELLLTGSDLTMKFGPFVIAGLVFGGVALSRWRQTEVGRRKTDFWLLRLPAIGKIYLYSSIYQTTNLMATLLASGVNTTETLRLVEKAIPNVILRAKFAAARKQIQEGVSMATAIQRVRYMPDLAMDILTVGENTGNVVSSLQDINKVYREELTGALNRMTNMTVALGLGGAFALVGFIAISVVLAVLSVSQSLQQ